MHDLYVHFAKYEDCLRDKEPIDLIFFYTSFHYITKGYGYFGDVRLGPGQYFFAAQNHYAHYYPDPTEPWSYYYFDLYGKGANEALTAYGLDMARPYGDFLCMDQIPRLMQLFLECTNHYVDNRAFRHAMVDMLLSLHQAQPIDRDPLSKAWRHVEDIREYMRQNMQYKISLEALARQFFLSRQYVRNLFVRYENMSPKQYLQKLRMERAEELLLQTRYDITMIANAVGYSDPFAFSRAFRQYTGLSPTQYRLDHHW